MRQKKQHLKRRADGRYACKYKDKFFYGATEEEALEAREAYKQAERLGSSLHDTTTLADYALAWLPVAKAAVADSTYHEAAIHLEKLLKHVGHMRPSDIKPIQIKQVFNAEYAGYSHGYTKKGKCLFRSLFDSAIESGLCSRNPARSKDATPDSGTFGGHRAITPTEREWITTFCTNHRAYPAVMAMLYAGLRPPEAKALNIDRDVDFSAGTITLTEFIHRDGYCRYTVSSEGKTKRSRRTIPLLSPLRQALTGKHGLLVTTAKGDLVTPDSWRSLWQSYRTQMETAINGCSKRKYKARVAAGESLPPWEEFTVVPYDLRHSFCTMCRDAGVELKTCATWMGHSNIMMVLRVYDQVSNERSSREIVKLETALIGSQNGSQIKKEEPETVVDKRLQLLG